MSKLEFNCVFMSFMKYARMKAGLSSGDLGRVLGISKFEVYDYESGKNVMPDELCQEIAELLCVSRQDILENEEVTISEEEYCNIKARYRPRKAKMDDSSSTSNENSFSKVTMLLCQKWRTI